MPDLPSMGILLDYTQDKVVLVDESGTLTYANDAAEQILGWCPEELIGEQMFELIHPDDVESVRATFEETITTDRFVQQTAQYRLRAKDGSWVWLESRMSNLTDDRLDGYVVSSRDVTDRIAAQRDRQETARRLSELAATTQDVLWMFDGDFSELLFVNPAYEAVFGQPLDGVENDSTAFLDAIHPDDVPVVEDAMGCLSAGNAVDIEFRVDPRTNYNTTVWVQGEPIVEDGEVIRVAGFVRDITDRSRRERQLGVMDKLLRHNLRNDMTTILGNAEVIEDEAPTVADRAAVIRRTGEQLLESADKEREIIDLLTSRTTRTQVDLHETVVSAVETVRERYPEALIDAVVPETATACALEEIELAVAELLENGVCHCPHERPTVRVAVEPSGEDVTVTIDDVGPRMPEMEARVLTGDHEMNDLYHSTGLGLWLVHWVVELSDGRITVTDDGDTNRITLHLPRHRGEP